MSAVATARVVSEIYREKAADEQAKVARESRDRNEAHSAGPAHGQEGQGEDHSRR